LSRFTSPEDDRLFQLKKQAIALKTAKEIVIKFVEAGQVTPSSFQETFRSVYSEIKRALDLAD